MKAQTIVAYTMMKGLLSSLSSLRLSNSTTSTSKLIPSSSSSSFQNKLINKSYSTEASTLGNLRSSPGSSHSVSSMTIHC